jgi:hypothetical protein
MLPSEIALWITASTAGMATARVGTTAPAEAVSTVAEITPKAAMSRMKIGDTRMNEGAPSFRVLRGKVGGSADAAFDFDRKGEMF